MECKTTPEVLDLLRQLLSIIHTLRSKYMFRPAVRVLFVDRELAYTHLVRPEGERAFLVRQVRPGFAVDDLGVEWSLQPAQGYAVRQLVKTMVDLVPAERGLLPKKFQHSL